MPQNFDAIIIGAGVMGASIAFHLAERGLKIAILERNVTASGATGHSSGLVRMHYDLAAESELTFASYKHYFNNWKERVGDSKVLTVDPFVTSKRYAVAKYTWSANIKVFNVGIVVPHCDATTLVAVALFGVVTLHDAP